MSVQDVIERSRDLMTARLVFAEPVREGGVTVIAAARVGGGGGGGMGGRGEPATQEHGSGGGFGVTGRPVGAFVVREGTVRWRPAVDVNRAIAIGGVVAVTGLLVLGSLLRGRPGRRGRR
jgi:uncharacterized spore protein YtfJ